MEGFRTYNSDKEMKTTLVSVLSDRFTTDLQQQFNNNNNYNPLFTRDLVEAIGLPVWSCSLKKIFNTVKSRD